MNLDDFEAHLRERALATVLHGKGNKVRSVALNAEARRPLVVLLGRRMWLEKEVPAAVP